MTDPQTSSGVDKALEKLPKRYVDGKPRLPKEFIIGSFGSVADLPVNTVRNILDATYLYYVSYETIPTPDEISELCAKSDRGIGHSKDVIIRCMADDVFWSILKSRGINRFNDSGLTSKQILAITVLTDPARKDNVKDRLNSVGASYAEFRAWQRNPFFNKELKRVAGTNLSDNIDNLKTVMLSGALSGDLNKAKFVMELAGEYDPSRKEVIQLQTVVSSLLEIITRVVTDPAQLATIAGGIQETLSKQGVTIKGELK